MKLLNIIIFIFFLSFSTFSLAQISFVQRVLVEKNNTAGVDNDGFFINGVTFNNDGTKMFTVFQDSDTANTNSHVSEYNLSTPFDISTSIFAGDNEKCRLNTNDETTGPVNRVYDIKFSNDGMRLFVARGSSTDTGADHDRVFGFELSSPFDVSTCSFSNNQTSGLDSESLQNGSNAGDLSSLGHKKVRLQGFDISKDGTKLFAIFHSVLSGSPNTRLLEYTMSTAFDLTTISLVTSGGIELEDETENPHGMVFSPDGTRLWTVDHTGGSQDVTQISLDVAYSTNSFTIDGTVNILNLNGADSFDQPRGIAFSALGLKMYIGTDQTNPDDGGGNHVNEIDLACPFNIVSSASCKSYTSKGRTAMAEAQAELAKRTINLSTNSALNRLKWIRRNKDKQNLSNQNIKLNFSNNLISSISQLPITSFKKIVSSKNKDKSDQKYFYWSEGSVSIGRIGDTSISQSKRIEANSLTFGFDKLTDEQGIQGYAFRFGNDETTLNLGESELDSETFNITYYSSAPIKNDNKLIDRIFGIGKIRSDILTNIDGKKFTADRNGNQIYGTVKIKDEFKRNNLIFIPSGQFDIGHTLLDRYEESGQNNGVIVDKQHVKTKNLRATIAVTQDLSNDKYEFKRHGKIEYLADLDRSSDFKYNYNFDKETKYAEKLHTGSLHNINAEIGLDIVFPNRYSIFVIYERNQTIKSAHSAQNDNLYIAIGYLPYEGAEYAFTINGSENLLSKLEFKKNVNGLNLSFNVNDDLTNLGDNREANIVLNKVF